jgi:hypothetical protein
MAMRKDELDNTGVTSYRCLALLERHYCEYPGIDLPLSIPGWLENS